MIRRNVRAGVAKLVSGLTHLPLFTFQGDGDLAAIGTTEIVHAAQRGERFTTIMLNNSNFG